MVAPKIREKKVMRAQARSGRKRYIRDMGTLHQASEKKSTGGTPKVKHARAKLAFWRDREDTYQRGRLIRLA